MTDKQIINQEEAIKMIKKLNEKLKNVDNYVVELRSNFYRMKQDLDCKEQECEKAKQNAQDTYDLWQALIESFNILQGEKIKLEQECEELKKEREKKRDHYFMISNENARLEDEKSRLGYDLNCKINKLKQTLAEIKEIAEEKAKVNDWLALDILQKISECEGIDERI